MFVKKGFTLVEILFVLIIMAGIVAYAVPSYRRAKERSRYEAAQGILVNIGNAIQFLKKDLALHENYTFSFPTEAASHQMPNGTGDLQLGCLLTPREYIQSGSSSGQRNNRFAEVLFGAKYLENFNIGGSAYNFYAINEGAGTPAVCQKNCVRSAGATTRVVACMCLSSTNNTTGCFYGAKMYEDGKVERFTTSNSECNK